MFSCCMCNKNTKTKTERNNCDEITVDNAKIVENTVKIQSSVLNNKIENKDKKLIVEDKECLKKLNGNATTVEVKSTDDTIAISDRNSENFQIKHENNIKNHDIELNSYSELIATNCHDESHKFPLENGIIGAVPSSLTTQQQLHCLYEAPAYIERRITAGPDEDGDDSVFESSIIDDPPVTVNKLIDEKKPDKQMIRWLSQEDDTNENIEDYGGMQEPPVTPVAKDELALRRHRFFSDLMNASKNSTEHRVRFDPLGPTIHSG